ncbi:MAG: hypothetical protein WDA75_11335 [Candidatus Latescibacterota bacterium]|jgi:hypothetical protein
MLNVDISCRHCQHFSHFSSNGTTSWRCDEHEQKIERPDPDWCVCRSWRPDPTFFPTDLIQYLGDAGPVTHLKSRELYRTYPEQDLMALH